MEEWTKPLPALLAVLSAGLGALILMIQSRLRQTAVADGRSEAVLTKDFKTFQGAFCRVYLLALAVEWLHLAYLFSILVHYGHHPGHIARIFLAGVVVQGAVEVLLELIGGFVPQKIRCMACLCLQTASSILLMHGAFGGLVFSRLLGGASTALLQSAFQAWMVDQHLSQGYPREWLVDTFSLVTTGMAGLAVSLSLVGGTFWNLLGVKGPVKFTIVLASCNALLTFSTWSRDPNKSCPPFSDTARLLTAAAQSLVSSKPFALITAVHALFEAAAAVFVFLWVPTIWSWEKIPDYERAAPYGLLYSMLMVCVLIGSLGFRVLAGSQDPSRNGGSRALDVQAALICLASCGAATFGFFLMHASGLTMGVQGGGGLALAGCLVFQLAAGAEMNAVDQLKRSYAPMVGKELATKGVRFLTTVTAITVATLITQYTPGVLVMWCVVLCAGATWLCAVLRREVMAGSTGEDEDGNANDGGGGRGGADRSSNSSSSDAGKGHTATPLSAGTLAAASSPMGGGGEGPSWAHNSPARGSAL